MRNSSKIDYMLANMFGKGAVKHSKRGNISATKKRVVDKRWEELQQEADETLYGKKRRKR